MSLGTPSPTSDHPPLQYTGVLAPGGQGHTVIPQEGHIRHMAAVSSVFVAEGSRLTARIAKQVDFAKVVS